MCVPGLSGERPPPRGRRCCCRRPASAAASASSVGTSVGIGVGSGVGAAVAGMGVATAVCSGVCAVGVAQRSPPRRERSHQSSATAPRSRPLPACTRGARRNCRRCRARNSPAPASRRGKRSASLPDSRSPSTAAARRPFSSRASSAGSASATVAQKSRSSRHTSVRFMELHLLCHRIGISYNKIVTIKPKNVKENCAISINFQRCQPCQLAKILASKEETSMLESAHGRKEALSRRRGAGLLQTPLSERIRRRPHGRGRGDRPCAPAR